MAVYGLKGGMPLTQKPTAEETDKKLKDVSQMYEKQFLREMLKAMRGTVHESGLIKTSQAEQIFREQLDGEYVDKWGEKGGIGLADLIHQQLVDRYGAKLGLSAPIARPQGPIALGEKANFSGKPVPSAGAEAGNKTTFRFDRVAVGESELRPPGLGAGLGADGLKAPWSGLLLGSRQLGSDETLMELQHDNGLKSQLVFRGIAAPGLQGTPIQAGQTIGLLSPEANSFFWTLENGPKSVSE